jgi:hypothetical protein
MHRINVKKLDIKKIKINKTCFKIRSKHNKQQKSHTDPATDGFFTAALLLLLACGDLWLEDEREQRFLDLGHHHVQLGRAQRVVVAVEGRAHVAGFEKHERPHFHLFSNFLAFSLLIPFFLFKFNFFIIFQPIRLRF